MTRSALKQILKIFPNDDFFRMIRTAPDENTRSEAARLILRLVRFRLALDVLSTVLDQREIEGEEGAALATIFASLKRVADDALAYEPPDPMTIEQLSAQADAIAVAAAVSASIHPLGRA